MMNMAEHNCGLSSHLQNKHMSSSMAKGKRYILLEKFKRLFNVSANTPKTNLYLHSMAAAFAEERRHDALPYWWIIHPFSRWRFVWDMIMLVVYMIAFLTIPFFVCYVVMSHDATRVDNFNIVIYLICWVDIGTSCISGYYAKEQKQVQLDPWIILSYYMKTYFILDVLTSLPWDHITLPWRYPPGMKTNIMVIVLNLLPLLKLFRYTHMINSLFELFTYLGVMHLYYEVFTTILLAIYMMFWCACLSYLIPALMLHITSTRPEDCEECWMTGLDHASIGHRFQHSFFMVVEKVSTSGYGLYIPVTDGHLILSSFLMVMGRLLDCYIVVMVIQIKALARQSKSKFHEIMNQVIAYTIQKQLPTHMKNRLLNYYRHRFRYSYFREKSILMNLSEQLRMEIAFQANHRLVENVAIFKAMPKHLLRAIVKSLKFELYLPNDVIVKAGAHGDCMFFISAGTVAVLTPTGKEICHLDDGAHFGEVALLVPDQRRVASVIAIEVCEVYRLDRKDFRKCIAVHTELFAKLEYIASERIQRAVDIEEQHKRYLLRNSSHEQPLRVSIG
ncbi:potassium/sodium hyperpolarization-activated cyclic nucleotide-gated channel 1 [Lasioglossum baleicum]|uniref:potassium/sodium hyperpolarization-activated cyclic nucleotide-gated channel 1 n=1 Tax=Lasioglossum baleicum TaxID=434251 RepID=UPI003FCCE5C1